MSNEIVYRHSASATTLYAQVLSAAGQAYNGAGFETIVDANWGDYAIVLAEAGTASQVYLGDFPPVTPGAYTIFVYEQAGGSPAVSDELVGAGQIDWGGTAQLSLSAVPWNLAWDEGVEANVTDALVTYDPPTRAEATADKDEILVAVGEGSGGGPGGGETLYEWTLDGEHEVVFYLTDASGSPVTGLGSVTVEVRKPGGLFEAGVGTSGEIEDGWYSYVNDTAEADTVGPVILRASGAGTIEKYALAVVRTLQINAVYYTYTVTNVTTGNPAPDVRVWVTTDVAGSNIIINNLLTDAFGVARHPDGSLPLLDPGTYFFWKRKVGVADNDNPDLEVVG